MLEVNWGKVGMADLVVVRSAARGEVGFNEMKEEIVG